MLAYDDLLFEDEHRPRPTTVANRWLREWPASGGPAPRSRAAFARAVRDLAMLGAERGFGLFDDRYRLRTPPGTDAAWRACGPVGLRVEATTWALHMSILVSLYQWAVAEGHATAEPVHLPACHNDLRRPGQPHGAPRPDPPPSQ